MIIERTQNNSFSAAILGGGNSRRMGTDKKKLQWNGNTLLEVILQNLEGCEDIMISLRNMEDQIPKKGRCILDRYQDAGPLAGLEAALFEAAEEIVFVTTCDAPLVNLETAKILVGAIGEYDAAIPRTKDGRVHPLIAVYRKSVLVTVQKQLEQGEFRLMDLIGSLNVCYVEGAAFPEGDLTFSNLNTPTDWDHFIKNRNEGKE